MQDSKYKYMFPPEKGQPYPENCEVLDTRHPSSWTKPSEWYMGKPSDGSFLRDCWLMRVPLLHWAVGTDSFKNTYWVCCRDDGSRKYIIYQTIRENKIVFITCKCECFNTLDEAKNSY
jgi:hypothetical protein